MDTPTTTSQPPAPGFAGYGSALTLVLAYGGVGALQWFHGIVRPDADGHPSLSVAHWLRDGTRHSGSFARPGDYHVYQWRATPGTAGYWHYHDHVVGDDEGTVGIENGFYGGLIVRKPGDLRPVKTFMMVFHNLTINGRQYPNTPTLTARQGDLVEFLVVSYMDTLHSFHLHAHRWLTPVRPGNLPSSRGGSLGYGREDNHILSPGDSFGFMTIAGEDADPGMWMYHCHVQSHSGLMLGFFQVLPPAEPPRGR